MSKVAAKVHEVKSEKQPLVIWVLFFACIISFMGLGLVDPILPAIGAQMHATTSQVSLLFTSYNAIMGISMIFTGMVSSKIGIKWTLITGVCLVILFSALSGSSSSISQIIWFRVGWGLGNALFIATALSAIVSLSNSGPLKSIILYEAAIGLGISVGPLLGGELGAITWRGPFYGVSVLMLIVLIALIIKMPNLPKSGKKISILDPLKALTNRGLFTLGLTAFLYNIGFFTLLAFTPFILAEMGLKEHGLGYVFLGWGIALAITSVFVAPRMQQYFGSIKSMRWVLFLFALTLFSMGVGIDSEVWLISAVVIAGLFLGANNTLITTSVMNISSVDRGVASSAYNFVRFLGGAVGPWLAPKLAEAYNGQIPFYVGGAFVLIAVVTVWANKKHLAHVDHIEGH